MSNFRFIHAADLHIGSQMQKLELYPGAPAGKMRAAPQQAVERLVDHAIENRVQALVIAGDLFDGPWPDVRVGLWLVEQMRKLDREKIPVYCIRGNHDALSVVSNAIEWPKNVFEFTEKGETAPLLDCGLAVHGRSFDHPKVTEDLAATYPQAVQGAFNVGILHTSLTGSSLHDPYAPTDLRVLNDKGYHYWGLGHIHMRSEQSLSDSCWVGYSGNTQGRSVRETGPKGCYLIDVQDHHIQEVRFLSTEVARWNVAQLDLSGLETIDDIKQLARERLESIALQNGNLITAVRIVCTGSTKLHGGLGNPSVYENLLGSLRSIASDIDNAWLEKVEIRTKPMKSSDTLQVSERIVAEIREVLQGIQVEGTFDESFSEVKQLLQQKMTAQMMELGWVSESDPNWRPDWESIAEQAQQYLEGCLLGEEVA